MGVAGISLALLLPLLLLGQSQDDPGIPVGDPLVIAKCSPCHARDEHGFLQRISRERAAPEAWQDAVKKMVLERHVSLRPEEARAVVRYLSAQHGLAPEEARVVMYSSERRIHDETAISAADALGACTQCHSPVRALLWRRSRDDWQQLLDTHRTQYNVQADPAVIDYLSKMAPLQSADWKRWKAQASRPGPTGTWLATAHLPGHGTYVGEIQIQPGTSADEFITRATLTSIQDGASFVRTGEAVLFGGYAWRGRSRGALPASAPNDPSNEAREALWFSPDGVHAEGRWFWGQYQEFGFDINMQRRSSQPILLAIDRPALKTGSQRNMVRLFGVNFPAAMSNQDLDFGAGVTVRRIASHNEREVTAEVDVAQFVVPGKRDVVLESAPQSSMLRAALAIYDRVDYIKVTPESSTASFPSPRFQPGFQQLEAMGYQRGPDGKPHTPDDLELGPIPANWSIQVFYALSSAGNDKVASINQQGLLTPAAQNPGANFDIWAVATATTETAPDGRHLTGKGYVVVAKPDYIFQGRHYIRDLDRWIEDGQ